MIFVGIGANLDHPRYGGPRETCEAALALLEESPEIEILRRSRWYRSAPVPASDQPWYVNAVVALETCLEPAGLLARLHAVEQHFGRVRRARNEARVLDLDLLAYHDLVTGPQDTPRLPHPRLAERAFVLLPLAELAPDWRHPEDGTPISSLIARLPENQAIEAMD
jgi:2-amino-4-hydroxy-6-hydroxymethyldihydropteridine diphosphokinase